MAQQYGKIDSALVVHHHFRQLSERAKLVCLFLRASPHNNAVGCFYYPASHLADDLDTPFEGASEALRELGQRAFAMYCPVTRWVLIPKYLEHFPVKGRNSGKHALDVLDTVPRDFTFAAHLLTVFDSNHDWRGDNEQAALDLRWYEIARSFEGACEGALEGLLSRARPNTTTNINTSSSSNHSGEPPAASPLHDPTGAPPKGMAPIVYDKLAARGSAR